MASSCRIFTAVMLAIHLVVGCCSHHAHACDETSPSASIPDDCAPSCPGLHGLACAASHGQHDCHGLKCSMVRSTRDAALQLLLERCQAPSGLMSGEESPLLGTTIPQHAFSSGRLLLPVPLHLANQVLLI